ncbi:hypothetical protein ECE50_014030 [Chitinophaga sp. Mgbs1]|uniref:MoxR-vWA-beta-propeller ternary system domain-containing protein n=1 Tax=Chitinophaga solisilvae TaxID=1233460 RepID=A0A433WC43_9BACT|nr:hypothetical protein [Chitinophaga solisilvae]
MNLSVFITTLVRENQVTVATGMHAFSREELAESVPLLQNYYQHDIADMPDIAPEFAAHSALQAAQYIYRIASLTQSRQYSAATLRDLLPILSSATGPADIYSADLCLRYLPDLISLAKGLPATDPLMIHMKEMAARWPFSSTGMNILPLEGVGIITGHPSLLQAYADRIIASKDIQRCDDPQVMAAVTASLGNYADLLWPGFNTAPTPGLSA